MKPRLVKYQPLLLPTQSCTCEQPYTVRGATVTIRKSVYANVPPVCLTCRGEVAT